MAAVQVVPRGYYSATEYRFREDEADGIVRAAAYHRKDFCLSVIWFPPREHAGVRSSLETPFPRTSDAGLGSLDRLPLELLHDILLRLDMHSLLKFRQTNTMSRQAVDSLKEYQLVVTHGLNLLCALLRTRLASSVSLFEFHRALCTKACTFCGEFGGFVSLLFWHRCCVKCIQKAPETQMQTPFGVMRQFRTGRVLTDQLRSFESLPGTYSMRESVCENPKVLVSLYEARLVAGKQPRDHLNRGRNQKFNFMGSCALPYYDRRSGRVEHGMSCAGCQLALEKDIIGSRGEKWAFRARDKVYSQDGFLKHFQWCEQAQLLWKSSDGGTKQPAELPEAVRNGGYFKDRE